MKRFVVLSLLIASMLGGCGTSPVGPLAKATQGKASASWTETTSKVQLLSAKKRVYQEGTMRVSLSYRVTSDATEGKPSVVRTLSIDSKPTQDKIVFRSGYQPIQVILDGRHVLHDDETLLMLAREQDALAYHTVDKEEARIVDLASQLLFDLVH